MPTTAVQRRQVIVSLVLVQFLLVWLFYSGVIQGKDNGMTNVLETKDRWYFLHFHKSAGTTLCGIMRNSEDVLALSPHEHAHNCNSRADIRREDVYAQAQEPRSNDTLDTCTRLALEYTEEEVTVISRETWFDYARSSSTAIPDTLCPDIHYITVMREPVSRILSHLKFEEVVAAEALEWIRGTAAFPLENKHLGVFMLDNFYIRTLLFEDAFYLPLGAINETHLERAKLLLSQFYLVVPLTEWNTGVQQVLGHLHHWNTHIDSTETYCPFFCSRVDKWELFPRTVTDWYRTLRWNYYASSATEDGMLRTELTALNQWDLLLYKYLVNDVFPEQLKDRLYEQDL